MHDTEAPAPLLGRGLDGPDAEAYRAKVAGLLREAVYPLLARSEEERRFPREAVEALGAAGVFRERWHGEHGDPGKALIFAEELGRAGLGGVGVGLIVQCESLIPILRWFGHGAEIRDLEDALLDGAAVGSIAASEAVGGSDFAAAQTTATADGDGWRIRGQKWFSGPAGAADFSLILCRLEGAQSIFGPPLAVAVVDREQFEVRQLKTWGCRSLQTSRLAIDAHIPRDRLLASDGRGFHALTWGLTYERLAGAAQALGTADTAIRLATAHLHRRRQFGVPLYEQQALRLRLSALAAETMLARQGTHAIASRFSKPDRRTIREVAGVKVTAARLAERVVSECMHMFGGAGFLEDETPLARLTRDVRLARLGGGSDEIMWELFARTLEVDDALYERLTAIERGGDVQSPALPTRTI